MGGIKKLLLFILVSITPEYKRARLYHIFLGVKFGQNVRISGIPFFGSEPFLVTIGDNVTITKGVTFHNHDGGVSVLRLKHPKIDVFRPITIGNNVFIGSNTTLLPGVKVGNNVVIAASSVVTKDIPDNVVAGGVPAKVLKSLEEYEKKVLPEAVVLSNRKHGSARRNEIIEKLK